MQRSRLLPDVGGAAVRPLAASVLAGERRLPVGPGWRDLLPDRGLARGRTFACTGPAGWSAAFALVAEAVGHGGWVAAIDAPTLGAEAVAELGVPLDRLVRIDARATASWAEVVAAAVDGFELVVAQAPAGSSGPVRRAQTRVKARGAVLVLVGECAVADVQVRTSQPVWERAAGGAGHLRARRVRVEIAGRRVPRPRQVELWLPAAGGGAAAVSSRASAAGDGSVASGAGGSGRELREQAS